MLRVEYLFTIDMMQHCISLNKWPHLLVAKLAQPIIEQHKQLVFAQLRTYDIGIELFVFNFALVHEFEQTVKCSEIMSKIGLVLREECIEGDLNALEF